MSSEKKSLFPIRSSSTDSSVFLLGTISESEIQTLLHLRAFPDDLRTGVQKTIATTAQQYRTKPRLFLLNTAIQGECHV